ncbi:hypothetical protein MRX96_001629 [Rhipicephalus microplus]
MAFPTTFAILSRQAGFRLLLLSEEPLAAGATRPVRLSIPTWALLYRYHPGLLGVTKTTRPLQPATGGPHPIRCPVCATQCPLHGQPRCIPVRPFKRVVLALCLDLRNRVAAFFARH